MMTQHSNCGWAAITSVPPALSWPPHHPAPGARQPTSKGRTARLLLCSLPPSVTSLHPGHLAKVTKAEADCQLYFSTHQLRPVPGTRVPLLVASRASPSGHSLHSGEGLPGAPLPCRRMQPLSVSLGAVALPPPHPSASPDWTPVRQTRQPCGCSLGTSHRRSTNGVSLSAFSPPRSSQLRGALHGPHPALHTLSQLLPHPNSVGEACIASKEPACFRGAVLSALGGGGREFSKCCAGD